MSEDIESIRRRCANIKQEDWAAIGKDFEVVGVDMRNVMDDVEEMFGGTKKRKEDGMNDSDAKMLEKVVDVLSTKAEGTIGEYAKSLLVSSAVWLVFGAFLVLGGLCFKVPDVEEMCKLLGVSSAEVTPALVFAWVGKGGGMLLGAFMVASQVADLCYPRAAAISKLLCEINPASGE